VRALYSMKMPEGKALRDPLRRERFPSSPARLWRTLGEGLSL